MEFETKIKLVDEGYVIQIVVSGPSLARTIGLAEALDKVAQDMLLESSETASVQDVLAANIADIEDKLANLEDQSGDEYDMLTSRLNTLKRRHRTGAI